MSRFTELCATFAKEGPLNRDIMAPRRRSPEWSLLPIAASLEKSTQETAVPTAFPRCYLKPFVERLKKNREDAAAALYRKRKKLLIEQQGNQFSTEKAQDYLNLLTGAITSWGDPKNIPILKRFGVVVHETYNSFFKEIRTEPSDPDKGSYYPPMIDLSGDDHWGPHAINGREMLEFNDSSIGVISLPVSYGSHPLLWTTLAHEVGGHSAMNGLAGRRGAFWAVRDVPAEIEEAVGAVTGLAQGWNKVWQHWAIEAAADVYGLLFMGPYFIVSLTAWLSAAKAIDPFGPQTKIGCLENVLYLRNGMLADDHPPDILRLWIALGVADAMIEKNHHHARSWIELFDEIGLDAKGAATTLDVHDIMVGGISCQLELKPLLQDARKIGKLIATASLKSLGRDGGSRAIIDMLAWTNDDEQSAAAIKKIAASNTPLTQSGPGKPEAAHLLAGATMAVYDRPGDYSKINRFLDAALEARYPFTQYAQPAPTSRQAQSIPSRAETPD